MAFGVAMGLFAITLTAYLFELVFEGRFDRRKVYVDVVLRQLGPKLWAVPPTKSDTPPHRFRITLFQEVKIGRLRHPLARKSFTHKLVPRTRISDTTKKPTSIWFVHEEHLTKCEGVAGQIYGRNQRFVTQPLPDLHDPQDSSAGSLAKSAEYAKLAFSTAQRVRKQKFGSRIIGGIPIQRVDGTRWGVLVYDCVDPQAITPDSLGKPEAKLLASLMTQILARAEA